MLLLGGRTQASSRTTFAYTPAAVWRYFLVAHQRYFGEFFPCKSKTYKESHPLRHVSRPGSYLTHSTGPFSLCAVGKFSAAPQFAQRVGQGTIADLARGAEKSGLRVPECAT